MYTFWKRSAPPASMEILNAPSREFCTVRRERTNTPMQALVVLNDPQFIEASRYLAQRTLTVAGDAVENRLDFLGRRLLARPWRMEELAVLQTSVANLVAYYQAHRRRSQTVDRRGREPGRRGPGRGHPGRLDDVGQRDHESGRSGLQIIFSVAV